ncbi:MAG: hypothetical protein JWM44_3119 [Bacilli bacterium]|nr:hypothetical protein [Bacilli bacterium]
MLKVIERKNVRVLTTVQVAELFGTETKVISYNFNYNKERYQEGLHYIVLSGIERKEFLFNNMEIHDGLKHAKFIYLWTEKGAFLHAKSLNTDKAWNAYSQLVDDYFKKVEEAKQPQTTSPDLTGLSPQLQFMIQMEQKHNALEAKLTMYESNQNQTNEAMNTLTENLLAVPDSAKVVATINEYARWTRLGHNEIYNNIYAILKQKHGIDVKQRVENEREKAQKAYSERTGKYYSESTLKGRINGMDVMVRMGCLDKFNTILVGLLSKEKIKSTLSLVR